MAASPEKHIGDLAGLWVLNKSLSGDIDAILTFQGIGWWKRKAIGLATVTLHVTQYITEGITHIDIKQTATGGIEGTTELRELDWVQRTHNDHIFGEVTGRSRWATLESIEDAYLKEGWLDGEEEKKGPNGELLVENYVEAKAGWNGRQLWGFSIIDGERRYTRRVVITKGSESKKVVMVYNWQGLE
ncbi:hypothetical protein BJ878DRAFT_136202 [Calycina marina]|uniref:Lccl domain-containing protein n=1 Tax=Calycina marina TaxID=1763456 RepID=A0A9P7Z0K7_9HELO|nr:hypothetical protein BJ878DRAFT_136202 [Calycina marina]